LPVRWSRRQAAARPPTRVDSSTPWKAPFRTLRAGSYRSAQPAVINISESLRRGIHAELEFKSELQKRASLSVVRTLQMLPEEPRSSFFGPKLPTITRRISSSRPSRFAVALSSCRAVYGLTFRKGPIGNAATE
jgi:hypothetical protein